MKRILLLLTLTSCSWGMGESRGWISARQEKSARTTYAAAEMVEEALIDLPEESTTEAKLYLGVIKDRATDDVAVAKMMQADHGHQPEELPELGSPEDSEGVNTYNALAEGREKRRKALGELAGKIGGFLAGIVKGAVRAVVPSWLLWLLGVCVAAVVVFFAISLILWIRGRVFKQASYQLVQLAEGHIPKDVLRSTEGSAAQKVFRRVRDKGLLK